MPEKLYRIPEVMEYLGFSKPTIYRMMREGRLRSTKIGGARRIPESALVELINAGSSTGGDAA